jgi:U5 small nuclear ribonucleoprotein component
MCCRFGNFIGEAEESEDDSQHGVDAGAYVYDDYPEEAPETTGQELMEIDGNSLAAYSERS